MSVYQKLMQARVEILRRDLKKTGQNKFAGYKYFELGDFVPAALEIFDKLGLCSVISFTADTATMRIIDVSDNTEIVITSPMGSAALKGVHEVQNIGAVETYQRRYLWVAALEIVEHDALDSSEPLKEEKDMRANPSKLVAESVADHISNQRKGDLTEDALKIVTAFKGLRTDLVMEIYDSITDNDEKAYLWHLLAKESKVRTFIKAQAAERRTVTA